MNLDSRTDRSDIIRQVREQASRVYLQTIAANEREDRLLHKKLDALDLEHRAQYLKMKKWIYDAKKISKKRVKKVESYHTCDSEVCREQAKAKTKLGGQFSLDSADIAESCKANENLKAKSQSLPSISHPRRPSIMLHDRVKYTESEVARLKTSFAGHKTPPNLRRGRKFLPHLEVAGTQTTTRPRKVKGKKRKDLAKELNEDNNTGGINLPQITVEPSVTPTMKR